MRLTAEDRLHRMKFTQEFRFRRFAEAQAARSVSALPRRDPTLGYRIAAYTGAGLALVVLILEHLL